LRGLVGLAATRKLQRLDGKRRLQHRVLIAGAQPQRPAARRILGLALEPGVVGQRRRTGDQQERETAQAKGSVHGVRREWLPGCYAVPAVADAWGSGADATPLQ